MLLGNGYPPLNWGRAKQIEAGGPNWHNFEPFFTKVDKD